MSGTTVITVKVELAAAARSTASASARSAWDEPSIATRIRQNMLDRLVVSFGQVREVRLDY
jgi:hypothetical protein